MRTRTSSLFVAAATLCPLVAGQEGNPGGPVSVMRNACGLERQGDQLVGIGPGYIATFDRAGFTFKPALGSAAPRSYPTRFVAAGLRRDDVRWSISDAAPEADSAHRVTFDRGRGVTERYDVRAEGVEMSFVLEQPLRGSGDLVVELRLETDLALAESGAEGISFRSPHGGIDIGAVTGIDAGGRSIAGALALRGDHLELVLPERFVDQASYPLVVDPLVSGALPIGSTITNPSNAPDVAYADIDGMYLVVWEQTISATESHILGQRINILGAATGSLIQIAVGSTFRSQPTVANCVASRRFCVAWQQGASLLATSEIWGCAVNSWDGASSASTNLSSPWRGKKPDLGSSSSITRAEVHLTYENDLGSVGATLVGVPSFGDLSLVTSTGTIGVGNASPAISKYGDASGRHLIAWGDQESSPTRVCVGYADPNQVNPWRVAHIPSSLPCGTPDVDGDGTEFVVIYEQAESQSSSFTDVYACKVTLDTAGNATIGTPVAIAATPGRIESAPAIAWLGTKYVAMWTEFHSSSFSSSVHILSLDPDTCVPCGTGQSFFSSGFLRGSIAVASALSGGAWVGATGNGINDECMFVYERRPNGPPFDGDIYAGRFEAIGAGGGIANVGGSCGLGGVADTNGIPLALGATNFAFTLRGALNSGNGVALFSLGIPDRRILCGTCFLTLPVAHAVLPVANGDADLPIPIICANHLIGGAFEVQWWPVDTTAGSYPCSLLPGVVGVSNSLQATMGL